MTNLLREILSCEVCENDQLISVLDLGKQPLCDDLVPLNDLRKCEEYPIEILFCERCFTAHQRYQVSKYALFPPAYHYRARHTKDVVNGMKQLVEDCQKSFGNLNQKKVLDIGCNDGSLLSIFKEKGAHTFGIEPTDAYTDAIEAGHQILNHYFCGEVSEKFVDKYGQPDIITFTNVFAHIENLPDLIRSLKILSHSGTIIVIENHYMGAILDKGQFDTFYHEHPRTYSYTSFVHIADSLGMKIQKAQFPERYGGNIRVYLVNSSTINHQVPEFSEAKSEKLFCKRFAYLAKRIEGWRLKEYDVVVDKVNRYGKLVAKAFPGRATIPIKLLGLNENHISAVYEKPLSGKIGHYVPGTRIPILSDEMMPLDTEILLNLAWHIPTEIELYMREKGYKGKLFEIMSTKDFAEMSECLQY